jgi:hypothetical protein
MWPFKSKPAENLAHAAHKLAHISADVMVGRNSRGIAMEDAGDWKAAIKLYEANVRDGFDGSHPYERLMIIYKRSGEREKAQRVARACLTQATAGLSDEVRARCSQVLSERKDSPEDIRNDD